MALSSATSTNEVIRKVINKLNRDRRYLLILLDDNDNNLYEEVKDAFVGLKYSIHKVEEINEIIKTNLPTKLELIFLKIIDDNIIMKIDYKINIFVISNTIPRSKVGYYSKICISGKLNVLINTDIPIIIDESLEAHSPVREFPQLRHRTFEASTMISSVVPPSLSSPPSAVSPPSLPSLPPSLPSLPSAVSPPSLPPSLPSPPLPVNIKETAMQELNSPKMVDSVGSPLRTGITSSLVMLPSPPIVSSPIVSSPIFPPSFRSFPPFGEGEPSPLILSSPSITSERSSSPQLEYLSSDEEVEEEVENILFTGIKKLVAGYDDMVIADENKFAKKFTVKLLIETGRTITKNTGKAWNIDIDIPLVVEIVYIGDDIKVSVYQSPDNVLYQLTMIVQRFIIANKNFGKTTREDPIYISKYGSEIEQYISSGIDRTDAITLHTLYKDDIDAGLLGYSNRTQNIYKLIKKYLLYRLPTISRYCILCDEVPIFLRGKDQHMLKPFVCTEPLCNFQLRTLNIAQDQGAAYGSLDLIHTITTMSIAAIRSDRIDLILSPYPTLISSAGEIICSPENKNNELLIKIAKTMPLKRSDRYLEQIATAHQNSFDLYQWIMNSNLSYIVNVAPEKLIPAVGSEEQYVLIMDSPHKEAVFQERKKIYGSVFAFHGSPFENFHAILRNGLIITSGSKLQMHGAIHGAGIYISPNIKYSIKYSRTSAISSYRCIALCELINTDIVRTTDRDIWTIPDPLNICTRYLIVYPPDYVIEDATLDTDNPDIVSLIHSLLS